MIIPPSNTSIDRRSLEKALLLFLMHYSPKHPYNKLDVFVIDANFLLKHAYVALSSSASSFSFSAMALPAMKTDEIWKVVRAVIDHRDVSTQGLAFKNARRNHLRGDASDIEAAVA